MPCGIRGFESGTDVMVSMADGMVGTDVVIRGDSAFMEFRGSAFSEHLGTGVEGTGDIRLRTTATIHMMIPSQ